MGAASAGRAPVRRVNKDTGTQTMGQPWVGGQKESKDRKDSSYYPWVKRTRYPLNVCANPYITGLQAPGHCQHGGQIINVATP